jgi:hypothetical protein
LEHPVYTIKFICIVVFIALFAGGEKRFRRGSEE